MSNYNREVALSRGAKRRDCSQECQANERTPFYKPPVPSKSKIRLAPYVKKMLIVYKKELEEKMKARCAKVKEVPDGRLLHDTDRKQRTSGVFTGCPCNSMIR